MAAIEQEEKPLRLTEARNEIYQMILDIEDVKTDEGQALLNQLTEQFERTFEPESDDEDGISDKDVIHTKLPWASLERAEDKDACERFCKALVKKENHLI